MSHHDLCPLARLTTGPVLECGECDRLRAAYAMGRADAGRDVRTLLDGVDPRQFGLYYTAVTAAAVLAERGAP